VGPSAAGRAPARAPGLSGGQRGSARAVHGRPVGARDNPGRASRDRMGLAAMGTYGRAPAFDDVTGAAVAAATCPGTAAARPVAVAVARIAAVGRIAAVAAPIHLATAGARATLSQAELREQPAQRAEVAVARTATVGRARRPAVGPTRAIAHRAAVRATLGPACRTTCRAAAVLGIASRAEGAEESPPPDPVAPGADRRRGEQQAQH